MSGLRAASKYGDSVEMGVGVVAGWRNVFVGQCPGAGLRPHMGTGVGEEGGGG